MIGRRLGPWLTVSIVGVLVLVAIALSVISSPERTAASDLRAAIARTLAATSFTVRGTATVGAPFSSSNAQPATETLLLDYQAPDRVRMDVYFRFGDCRSTNRPSCRSNAHSTVVAVGTTLYECLAGASGSIDTGCQVQSNDLSRRVVRVLFQTLLPNDLSKPGSHPVYVEHPGYLVQTSRSFDASGSSADIRVRIPIMATTVYGVDRGYVTSITETQTTAGGRVVGTLEFRYSAFGSSPPVEPPS